jgi:hypothetical protein
MFEGKKMIDRQTTIPLVLGAVICLAAVAFVSHGIAVSEFDWAVPTRTLSPDLMPAITACFWQAHHVWWILPTGAAIVAVILVLRPSCQAKHLAWFLSITATVAVLWGLFAALAICLVRTNFVC